MTNYCIQNLKDYRIENDLVVFDALYSSENESIEGEVSIGFTQQNDIVLRLDSWGTGFRNDFKPISYDLKKITDEDIDTSKNTVTVQKNGTKFVFDDSGIVIQDDNESLEVITSKTLDLKGNTCSNGTGFRTSEFNNNPEMIENVNFDLRLAQNERFYGGGERFKRVNHTETEFKVQVTQGAGVKQDKTYKAVPRFVSDKGYGFSINTYNTVDCKIGSESSEVASFTVQDSSCIEVVFTLPGNTKDCVSNLYEYESHNENPPKWSYGFWTSRNTYESWDEVMEIAEEYRDKNIPCDVIHLDPGWLGSFEDFSLEWSDSFSNAEQYISKLHDMNFKISLWLYPYIPTSSSMYKDTDRSYFVNDKNGENFIFDDIGKLAVVDFTNPDAFDWWANELSEVISDGVDVIKADFGEYISDETVFDNGKTGSEMRNAYPDLYQKACISAFEKVDREPLLWSRSGWLSQNTKSIHWNGDAESDWTGYRTTIQSGLNAAMSSYSFWSSDVGGYKTNPSDKLYGEWMKFSSLGSSHIRAHGKSPREPWEYQESYEDSKTALQERYRLLPYLYTYGQVAEEDGLPVMRPMSLVLDDIVHHDESTQYFVGEHILVAPYLTPDRNRELYLPNNSNWVSYWTNKIYEGGQVVNIEYDEENNIIPVFVREGAVIPVTDKQIQSVQEDYNTGLKVYGQSESVISTPYYDGESITRITNERNESLHSEDLDVNDHFEFIENVLD